MALGSIGRSHHGGAIYSSARRIHQGYSVEMQIATFLVKFACVISGAKPSESAVLPHVRIADLAALARAM